MPKLKTKSGVKKRFTLTATGKLKHGVAGKRHRLISHNGKYIRQNHGAPTTSNAHPHATGEVALASALKHKNILEQAKGYRGRRKNTIRVARQAVEKAGQYAYRDRKAKKRTFRGLWIQRINAAVRIEGLTYSEFMHGLKLAGVELDRKVLADIAMHEGEVFSTIIAQAKAALPAQAA